MVEASLKSDNSAIIHEKLSLIKSLRQKKQLPEAARVASQLAELAPDDRDLMERVFVILHHTRAYAPAIRHYRKCIKEKVFKPTPSMRVLMADCHIALGQLLQAEKSLRSLSRQSLPDNVKGIYDTVSSKLRNNEFLDRNLSEIHLASDAGEEVKLGVLIRNSLDKFRGPNPVRITDREPAPGDIYIAGNLTESVLKQIEFGTIVSGRLNEVNLFQVTSVQSLQTLVEAAEENSKILVVFDFSILDQSYISIGDHAALTASRGAYFAASLDDASARLSDMSQASDRVGSRAEDAAMFLGSLKRSGRNNNTDIYLTSPVKRKYSGRQQHQLNSNENYLIYKDALEASAASERMTYIDMDREISRAEELSSLSLSAESKWITLGFLLNHHLMLRP